MTPPRTDPAAKVEGPIRLRVEVLLGYGEPFEAASVEGIMSPTGLFALHPTFVGPIPDERAGWTISHIPTGAAICQGMPYRTLFRLLAIIEDLPPGPDAWRRTDLDYWRAYPVSRKPIDAALAAIEPKS